MVTNDVMVVVVVMRMPWLLKVVVRSDMVAIVTANMVVIIWFPWL